MAPTVPAPTANSTSVQVAVRIRPTTNHDLSSVPTRFQRTVIHPSSTTTVSVDNVSTAPQGVASPTSPPAPSAAGKKAVFAFDQVHPQETTQYQLFSSTAAPLISRFIEGFNCTILAYGQTSSGKTYSMTGIDLDADPNDPDNGMGIIPRSISTIFSKANEIKRERGSAWQWSIKASFIEIYNEDLIDLLAIDDSGGTKRDVQIREDKDGNIIWGGLREIPVRSAADVMAILIRGTALRRTNETDMNAQSSRSHAIFSITMTQKKYNGTSSPPRNGRSSPMPPNGSPSRLARPGSMLVGSSRVSSPTFGRSPTPSFAAAMSRGTGLRPSSALGMRPRSPEGDEDKGEWTTVVSKFHFVDLAGSERLKRTAAAGERVKEGISINGGLLALGNVISALGDPSRARTLGHGGAIHVPYRDSKLTRLLQDSLGGNAHTLMIACVSPAEYNAAETVNTLKYANRARNIRNRAEIREKEDGWDDLEWLQTMVTKLRKEVKALKEGGSIASSTTYDGAEEDGSLQNDVSPDRVSGKVLKQYADLQGMHRDLRRQFAERNDELSRLRKELADKSSSPTPGSGASKYEEIVGPVIEEYEKTISAMEAELKLARTALEHTNEMYNEQENELAIYKERTSNADGYIEALRTRVAKLAERETSTETYVRDLEAKLKAFNDSSSSSDDSVANLQKEIASYKEAEASSATYIVSLEQRLTRADADISSLRAQVEKLEQDMDRKNENLAQLQGRLDDFLREKQDLESWKENLDEREKRLQELEQKMEEWEKVRVETSQERQRLGSVVSEVEATRRSLEKEVADKETSGAMLSPSSIPLPPTIIPSSPTSTITPDAPNGDHHADELAALQQTHSTTLVELESVTSKYRDALREIADLSAQINEAKLQSDTSSEVGSESGASNRFPPKTPNNRRKTLNRRDTMDSLSPLSMPTSPTLASTPPNARRNFFRHAASSEGLHSRSQSQSLSQELSLQAFSRTSWAPGDSLLSPGSINPKASLKRELSQENIRTTESLEKEIHRLQEVLKDREAEISHLEKSLAASAPQYFPAVPPAPINAALPDVREEVDSNPSETLVGSPSSPSMGQLFDLKQSMLIDAQRQEAERKEAESISRLDELMRSMAQKESQHVALVDHLNDELADLRRQHDEVVGSTRLQAEEHSAESQAKSAEIEELRSSLATLGGQHAGVAEELVKLQAREAELLEARRVADENHVKELDDLRSAHAHEVKRREEESSALAEQHTAELAKLVASHAEASRALEETIELRELEGREALEKMSLEHSAAIDTMKAEHDTRLRETEEQHVARLAKLSEEHEKTLGSVHAEHEATLHKRTSEVEEAFSRLREDHAADLKRADIAREGTLTESQTRQAAVIQELHDEHQLALERKESNFKADLAKAQDEHEAQIAVIEEQHAVKVAKLVAEHDQRVAELTSTHEASQVGHAKELAAREVEHNRTIGLVHEEHRAQLDILQASKSDEVRSLSEELKRLKAEHETRTSQIQTSLAKAEEDHKAVAEALRSEHALAMQKLTSTLQEEAIALQTSLLKAQEDHRETIDKIRLTHEAQLEEERMLQTSALTELDDIHNEERATLRNAHDLLEEEVIGLKAAQEKARVESDQLRARLEQVSEGKDQEIDKLGQELASVRMEHAEFAQIIRDLNEELDRTRREQSSLIQEASKRESLVAELERHRSVLGDAQHDLQRTKDEMDTLRDEKNRQEQLLRELQSQIQAAKKASLEEGVLERPPNHRAGSVPPAKLPPLTPPPSIPPPPVPTSIPPVPPLPTESTSSSMSRSSTGSQGSLDETQSGRSTPSTSILAHSNGVDSKLQSQLVEQIRQIEEQETMIKTLNKQLTHCESDLQAHMDLVATLETSLTDSERNLRKSRMQANEYAKERDSLTSQVESLRGQLQQSQQEIASVRRSVVEEKQSFESRLEEERRAKERTRAQLDSRMEELQKRKSKFVCL